MSRIACLVALSLCCAACQTPAAQPASEPEAAPASRDPLAFAQAACGGCHSVDLPVASPNPQAPPFATIVNREGLTRETLSRWLYDAHNYPEEMDFDLDGPQADMLVEYMLTLRDPDYRPPPS